MKYKVTHKRGGGGGGVPGTEISPARLSACVDARNTVRASTTHKGCYYTVSPIHAGPMFR